MQRRQTVTEMKDEIEFEDVYHEVDAMVSMAAIEHEIEFLTNLCKTLANKPDDKDFFEMKIDSLDFQKGTIQTNIETGIVTPMIYVSQVKAYLQATEKLYKDCLQEHGESSQHTKRLRDRIKVLKSELNEMNEGM